MAVDVIGEVLGFGLAAKVLQNMNGQSRKLVRNHKTRASATQHAKVLRKKGKKVRILEGKDKNGKPIYGVYTKVKKRK